MPLLIVILTLVSLLIVILAPVPLLVVVLPPVPLLVVVLPPVPLLVVVLAPVPLSVVVLPPVSLSIVILAPVPLLITTRPLARVVADAHAPIVVSVLHGARLHGHASQRVRKGHRGQQHRSFLVHRHSPLHGLYGTWHGNAASRSRVETTSHAARRQRGAEYKIRQAGYAFGYIGGPWRITQGQPNNLLRTAWRGCSTLFDEIAHNSIVKLLSDIS
ncbi:hypothetical protein IHE30_12145 [Mycetohabitans sp. B46]